VQGQARQDKTRQDKTRTKQDKTRTRLKGKEGQGQETNKIKKTYMSGNYMGIT